MMSVARRLGRYQIGERIGTGGVADVYRAQVEGAAGFAKTLVVKCLRPHVADEPELVDALAREAKLAQRLHHGNIVQVFDYGVEDGRPYVVMEYVDGCSLHELLRDLLRHHECMGLEEALFVAEEIAAALRYMHAATDDEGTPLRLVHRDVKPRNVLVSREGVVKLTDFGIAKVAGDRDDTLPGVIKGTPAYLAPEQALGRGVDARTDVFALGLVLRDLLGEGLSANPCPDPRLDDELRAIYERATADDPATRYEDVPALLRALQRWRASHEVEAHPGHLAAWVRRARRQAPIARPVSLDAALLGDEGSGSLDDTLDEPEPHTRASATPAPATAHGLRRGLLVAVAVFALGGVAWATMRGGSPEARPPRPSDSAAEPDRTTPASPPKTDTAGPVGLAPPPRATPTPSAPAAPSPSAASSDASPASPGSSRAASAPDTPTTSSSSPKRAATDEPQQRPRPTGRTGRLIVSLLPWAEVTVDGRALGRVPIDVELSAGRHRVRLHNPQLGEVVKTIKLRAGQTYTLNKW
ncbi:MAG: serine/threonine-protein kinase [Myxococcota bacterium]